MRNAALALPVLVIDMGGTIAEGAPPPRAARGRIVRGAAALRFLNRERAVALEKIAPCDGAFWSDKGSPDLQFDDWLALARFIARHREAYAGFVVTHGTDTLAWASAVLSFALHGMPARVVLTGAMRPLAVRGSDGWRNVCLSLRAANDTARRGVSVAFGGKLFHGCRIRKLVDHPVKAFDDPLGRASAQHASRVPRRNLSSRARDFRLERNIAHLVVTPALSPADVRRCIASKGVVLETYASGTIPQSILPAVAAVARRRPVIVSVENGRRTSPGSAKYPPGILSVRNMTREAAVVKLMWALANAKNTAATRRLLATNVLGEISAET